MCVRMCGHIKVARTCEAMWQHKDHLISSSLSVPFLPLCCLTTYSLSSNVQALCSPAQSSASSDSADLWPHHPGIPATQPHTAHSIWHFSCMEKSPTKQHVLCVRETQAWFFCAATSPLITYSSAWMYSRVHMRALLCCIIPFMRLHWPYGKQKKYISKPQGEILLHYTVRALFSVHTTLYYLREPILPLFTLLLFIVKIWIADFPQMFCKVLGNLSETSWQWHPVTFHPHEFVRPRNLSHIRNSSLSTLLWLCNRLLSSSAAGEDHFHLNLQRISVEDNHPKPLGPCVTARDNNWALDSLTHFCTVIRLASLSEREWFSALIGLGKSQPGLLQPWLAVHTFFFLIACLYSLLIVYLFQLTHSTFSVISQPFCCALFLSAQSELVRIRVLH